MKAWSEQPSESVDATLDELEHAGIDLHPSRPGGPRGDAAGHGPDLAADHPHPHVRSAPGERPHLGIVGAGPVGATLGLALSRAGWPVVAVASRDAGRRERFTGLVPGARAFAEPAALLDEVEIVLLTVPDDAIGPLAAELRLYSGQAIVHTSGLFGSEVLDPAMAAGTQAGSFHPLVSIVDPLVAVDDLRGATVVVEGDDGLVALLATMAQDVGGTPVRLPAAAKPAYHAAAVLAAAGLVALLDAISETAASAGLDENGALAIYGRLATQTMAAAQRVGIAGSLTGPAVRGDAGTIHLHRATLERVAPEVLPIYDALTSRAIAIAVERRQMAPDVAERLRAALAEPR